MFLTDKQSNISENIIFLAEAKRVVQLQCNEQKLVYGKFTLVDSVYIYIAPLVCTRNCDRI